MIYRKIFFSEDSIRDLDTQVYTIHLKNKVERVNLTRYLALYKYAVWI